MTYGELVRDALEAPFEGWDFGVFDGRFSEDGVAEIDDDDVLPFGDASFELITSRHESYDPDEIRRVLSPGGVFLTQQVGGDDLAELNAALGAPPHGYRSWRLETATAELEDAGLEILWQQEASVPATFHDIGAIVMFLRITPWQIPDFAPDRYAQALQTLHPHMPLNASCHRFALLATTP